MVWPGSPLLAVTLALASPEQFSGQRRFCLGRTLLELGVCQRAGSRKAEDRLSPDHLDSWRSLVVKQSVKTKIK